MSRRVLIDCTSTLAAPFQSGIQRVVRNLIEHGSAVPGVATVVPFAFGRNRLYEVRRSQLTTRSSGTVHGRWVHKQNLNAWQRSLQRLPYRLSKIFYPRKLAQRVGHLRLQVVAQPLELRGDDILLLADASWRSTNWDTVEAARQQGVQVGSVIYDLIPITHPQVTGEDLGGHFTKWLQQVHLHSDFLLTISQATSQELAKYQLAQGLQPKPTLAFRLGSTLKLRELGRVKNRIRALFADGATAPQATYMMVGTLDPHKNHRCAIEAFDRLWSQGHNIRLLIVGRKGRNADDLLQSLRSHPEWCQRLIGIDDASDADIAFLYQQMRALIFASYTEGFGLPIVEALQQQRAVIASDIPVHREVAGGKARYFRTNDAEHLSQTILEQLKTPEPSRADTPLSMAPAPDLVLDWPTATRLALQKCVHLADLAADQWRQLPKAS
jgi:O-antigen biosynthesis alpha-1,2-rhamnosyltransferase